MPQGENLIFDNNSLTAGEKLLLIFQEAGFAVHTGWNSHHLNNWRDAPFTYLKKDGRPLNTGGGGVSWLEIPCLELLGRCFTPNRVLIIGNSFGWSTLLLSIIWREARIVGMDCGVQPPVDIAQKKLAQLLSWLRGDEAAVDTSPTYGIDLTNQLAKKHGLNAQAVLSTSPQDVGRVAEEYLNGPPDFVFIDGYHIPPQVVFDFEASYKVASKDCVYLFHDVINWGLRGAFNVCQQKSGLQGGILWRTPSGMALLYPKEKLELERVFRVFGDDETEMNRVREKLSKWKRAAAVERAILHNRYLKRIKDALIRR
jgi:predicted O-methyltransferase YrrM